MVAGKENEERGTAGVSTGGARLSSTRKGETQEDTTTAGPVVEGGGGGGGGGKVGWMAQQREGLRPLELDWLVFAFRSLRLALLIVRLRW